MGRYFGREPRYSQEEAEAQAKAAIDAAVSKGRPPAEEWKALGSRMGEINRELAARPPVDVLPPPPPRRGGDEKGSTGKATRPRVLSEILRPPVPPEPEPAAPRRRTTPAAPDPAPAKRATRAAAGGRAPAKRATQAPAPKAATPKKRPARATEPPAPTAAKRPATRNRPG